MGPAAGFDPGSSPAEILSTVSCPPPSGPQVIFVVGVQCQRPPLPPATPTALAHLVTACWADAPHERPAFTDIVPALAAELAAVKE
jgi:hypothetical protein